MSHKSITCSDTIEKQITKLRASIIVGCKLAKCWVEEREEKEALSLQVA
jgi:hypothetical protein